MANHVWSRSRVYDKGNGTKVVVPPPIELALILLDDHQRRRGSRTCPKCKSPINLQTGVCSACGQIGTGATSAWPRDETQAAVNRVFWMLAFLVFTVVVGSVIVLLFAYD